MFEGTRWVRELHRILPLEQRTVLTHRDLDSKAGVKYEWSIRQANGNEVKLTDRQMKEIILIIGEWKANGDKEF